MRKHYFTSKEDFDTYLRKERPEEIWLDEFSTEHAYLIIEEYGEKGFRGVYNKQGVITSGDVSDFTWLYKKGMYVK